MLRHGAILVVGAVRGPRSDAYRSEPLEKEEPLSRRIAKWNGAACWALGALGLVSSCVSAPSLDESRLVDLTHSLAENSPVAPHVAPFAYTKTQAPPGERWSVTARLDSPGRGGAYLQAPLTFAEGRRSTDELTPAQWIASIRVVDVSRACDKDRDYLATVEDLRRHERAHGRVQPGSAVLLRTGWDGRWSTRERYFGLGQDERPHHPGVEPSLARELAARRAELVGIDAPDIDGGFGTDQGASRVLAAANIPVLGNLAGLAALPPRGATLIAAPLKVRGGATVPARVFAVLP
jgi:kynurenine formamidase